ncbi:Peptidase S10 [Theobroma cacao]|nr:Peptidase S10 [Theobroma cacao]
MAIADDTNYYNIRKKCEGSLCYDFSNMEIFLNQKSVRDALGVWNINFASYSSTAYQAMLVDWIRNLKVGILALLEDVREYDLICTCLSNSRLVHAMEWSGQKKFVASLEVPFVVDAKKLEFVASLEVPFVVDGLEAKVLKTHGPLDFLKALFTTLDHGCKMDQNLKVGSALSSNSCRKGKRHDSLSIANTLKTWGQWLAGIRAPNGGKRLWFVTFPIAYESVLTYDKASKTMYGENAILNLPHVSNSD